MWGFYIIAAVFNAAGAVAFVLLACLPSLGASFYQAKDRLLSPAARASLTTFWRPCPLPPHPLPFLMSVPERQHCWNIARDSSSPECLRDDGCPMLTC